MPGIWPDRSDRRKLRCRRRHAGAARGLDGGLARAAESRRNDHQGISDELPGSFYRSRIPPPVHAAGSSSSAASGSARSPSAICCSDSGSPRPPIRSRRSSRTSRRRPRTSSSCSWRARRAIWSCSTTSRSSRSSTARCRRPICSRAIAPRSSTRTRSCSGRSSSSPSTAESARNSPSCFRTPPKIVDDIAIVKSMVDRRLQSRARPVPDEHRLAAVRPAQHGRLGHLRTGQRVAGPAGVRRLQLRREGSERRQFLLGQRLPADRLPGRPVPRQRRSGPVPVESRGRRSASCSATRSTRSGG